MIMIGLHYWTSPAPYAERESAHRESPAVAEAMCSFVNGGMLRKREAPNKYGGEYEATDALGAWVEGLTSVRWPVQVWVIPKNDPMDAAT
jgi:hypothetical protein